MKTECELLKKDNRLMNVQLEQQERERQAAREHSEGELLRVLEELQKREAEVERVKAKKRQEKAKRMALENALEVLKSEKAAIISEKTAIITEKGSILSEKEAWIREISDVKKENAKLTQLVRQAEQRCLQ